ncbi:MAG: efflux RND transporter periplasmic adaptor subunit [Candidatus Hydrogenedentota bacterium]
MRTLIIAVILGASALTLAGCGGPAEGMRTNKLDSTPDDLDMLVPVEVQTAEVGDISAFFETTTRVEAEKSVEVVSKGNGECESVLVNEGDDVESGQVIARLETDELTAQIRQTRVNVEQTRFQMEKAEEQLKEGIISPYEARNTRYAYEQALANLKMQELQLEYQTIEAPIDGVVTMRNIQQGQVVAQGTPIFRIVDPASYYLPIMPPEKELPRLALGQEAEVTIDSVKDHTLSARVRRINPSVDPTSGTVKVILDFAPEAASILREGSFARVKLVMETHKDTLLVPKDAVLEENARKYLMIAEQPTAEATDARTASAREEDAPPQNGDAVDSAREHTVEAPPHYIARRIEVDTGLENSNFIEVVDGVDAETLIVVLGQHSLKPETPVKLTTAEAEIESLTQGKAGEDRAAGSPRDNDTAG